MYINMHALTYTYILTYTLASSTGRLWRPAEASASSWDKQACTTSHRPRAMSSIGALIINYLYSYTFGGVPESYSIMGPKTLFELVGKAPILAVGLVS